jgi:hypothetical protein
MEAIIRINGKNKEKAAVTQFNVPSQYLNRGIEKYHEKPQPVSGPRFEPKPP